MDRREELHKLIDRLPESQIPEVHRLLERACELQVPGEAVEEELPTDFEALESMFQESARKIPQEEWDRLPKDLIENLDHYLYGVPKK